MDPKPNFSCDAGNEKLLFFLVSKEDQEYKQDCCGNLTLQFVVTAEVRNKILQSLYYLQLMKKADGIDATIRVMVPCAVYHHESEDVHEISSELFEKYGHGTLVDSFDQPLPPYNWCDQDDFVYLEIKLPDTKHPEYDHPVWIVYDREPVTVWEASSAFLDRLARLIVDTLL